MSITDRREDHKLEELQTALKSVQELFEFLEAAGVEATALHLVEKEVWKRILQIGRQATAWFLSQQGTGDLGESVVLESGRKLNRLERPRSRSYLSVFGEFELSRTVYGTREGQKIEFVPLDDRLSLPESKFSYLLQDWDQMLECEEPYAEVSQVIQKILGLKQHVDSLIRQARHRAQDVEAFRESRPAPPPAEEGEIVVVSADGKGVPIRHAADAEKIVAHESQRGPKPDRKKMAVVGAAYTIDPYVRTPEEVVEALFRKPGEPRPAAAARPEPCHKRLWASLTIDPGPHGDEDDARHGLASVFGWLSSEVETRNPQKQREMVCLMDGQPSLWEAARLFLQGFAVVWILDLLHVTSRVWQAARLFHPGDDAAARAFVRKSVLKILQGQVLQVIRSWKQQAGKRKLSAHARSQLRKISGYFKNNHQRMRYDEYLARGYPIASGVIEGACRHYVKDRMERAGMNWIVPGAQALLDLRSVYLNDQWDDFQEFAIARETARIHPHRKLVSGTKSPIAA